MGAWDIEPWDNDAAADWFMEMFDKTELADYVRSALTHLDVENEYDEVRAAASMVRLLGHNYVWPVETIDEDLELAASKLEKLLDVPEMQENENILNAVKSEISELRSRIASE